MKLHNATPANVPGISSVHVGTAESSEMARLVTEPHAVLREAGLKTTTAGAVPSPIVVAPGAPGATPSAIVVVPRINDDGKIDWVGVVIVNGDVIGDIPGPAHKQ
jgi:hypothetical protein